MFSASTAPGTSRQIGLGIPPSTPAQGMSSSTTSTTAAPAPWMQTHTSSPNATGHISGALGGGMPGMPQTQTNTLLSTPQQSTAPASSAFSTAQQQPPGSGSPFPGPSPHVPTGSAGGASSPTFAAGTNAPGYGGMQAPWGTTAPQASPASQAPVSYLPGYLSKMRGIERSHASSHRPSDTVPPSLKTEADTSTSILAQKDHGAGLSGASSTSPNPGFHSSFFSRSSMDYGDLNRSPSMSAVGNGMREGSIFGSTSLRGSRPPMEDGAADRSMSRPPTSPPLAASLASSTAAAVTAVPSFDAMDDDDAPPQQTLHDMPQVQGRAFDSSMTSGMLSSSVGAADDSSSSVRMPVSGQASPLAHRSVLVYGFPPLLRSVVVEQFSALGGLESIDDVSINPAQEKTLRLVFHEPIQALQAVSQNGRTLAGTCMVGVRWENDAMHQQSLVGGLDAPLLGVSSGAAFDPNVAPPMASTAPATPVSQLRASSARHTAGTPAFGRPIDKVESPGSALAQPTKDTAKTSALQSLWNMCPSMWNGHASSSTKSVDASIEIGSKQKPTTLLGHLAEGLFGW